MISIKGKGNRWLGWNDDFSFDQRSSRLRQTPARTTGMSRRRNNRFAASTFLFSPPCPRRSKASLPNPLLFSLISLLIIFFSFLFFLSKHTFIENNHNYFFFFFFCYFALLRSSSLLVNLTIVAPDHRDHPGNNNGFLYFVLFLCRSASCIPSPGGKGADPSLFRGRIDGSKILNKFPRISIGPEFQGFVRRRKKERNENRTLRDTLPRGEGSFSISRKFSPYTKVIKACSLRYTVSLC